MKKPAGILALILLVTVAWLPAWARGPYPGSPAAAANVTPEQREQFFKETESIRTSIWEKQKQLNRLVNNPESDPTQIGVLEKEITQLREGLRAKALEAGIACPMGGPGLGMGYGMGHRRGGCWQAGQ